MTTLLRRTRLKYIGDRNRGNIYTGAPGAPHWATTGKRRVNHHDHSATSSKRPQHYSCRCPHCGNDQAVAYGRGNRCSRCQERI